MNLATDIEDIVETRVGAVLRAKALWLDWAEIFDSWRIVPRAVLLSLLHMVVSLGFTLVYWYIHLPDGHRTAADAGAVVSIIGALSTLFGFSLKFYIDNGRMWGSK